MANDLVSATEGHSVLQAFTEGRSVHTRRAYEQDIEDFRAFLNTPTRDEALNQLFSSTAGAANGLVFSYKNHLVARNLSPSTVNRRLSALRSLGKLARTLGWVSWTLEVENVRSTAYRDTRGPGREGIVRLFEICESVRDLAMLHLLYDLGLRRGEVVSLNISDVDLERGTLLVQGKGYREKTLLTLPATAQKAIAKWLEVHPRPENSDALFTNFDHAERGAEQRLTGHSLYRIIRALGEKAGIVTRPHGIRHTAITEAVIAARANNIGLEEVADFSRHKSIATLLIYRDRERNVQGKLSELISAFPTLPLPEDPHTAPETNPE